LKFEESPSFSFFDFLEFQTNKETKHNKKNRSGRVNIFHGINSVNKGEPYYSDLSGKISFLVCVFFFFKKKIKF